MRSFIASCLLICISVSHAVYAASCEPVKIKTQNKNLVLLDNAPKGKVQVYFFKNNGTQGIWLDHPVAHASASAGWSSYVRAGNWSAFLVNRKNFEISCGVIQPGKVDYLDCSQVISVCAPKDPQFKTPPKGTYWLVEDKSWDELVKAAQKRGVTFK